MRDGERRASELLLHFDWGSGAIADVLLLEVKRLEAEGGGQQGGGGGGGGGEGGKEGGRGASNGKKQNGGAAADELLADPQQYASPQSPLPPPVPQLSPLLATWQVPRRGAALPAHSLADG